jgi:hypothetical protein
MTNLDAGRADFRRRSGLETLRMAPPHTRATLDINSTERDPVPAKQLRLASLPPSRQRARMRAEHAHQAVGHRLDLRQGLEVIVDEQEHVLVELGGRVDDAAPSTIGPAPASRRCAAAVGTKACGMRSNSAASFIARMLRAISAGSSRVPER